MKKLGLILIPSLVASGTALAGSATYEAPMEPVVQVTQSATPAPISQGGNWTGAYGGFQLGYGDVETTGAATETGDDLLYGVHGGYNYDFGRFVLGGELDYDFSDISLSGAGGDIDSIGRAKLKAGYDLGSTLLYGTAGVAVADATLGNDNGTFYGVGVSYQMTPDWTVGGEVLAHQFDDFDGTGVDIEANTLSLRASYNF